MVKRIECDICGKMILGFFHLRRHYKAIHDQQLLSDSSKLMEA